MDENNNMNPQQPATDAPQGDTATPLTPPPVNSAPETPPPINPTPVTPPPTSNTYIQVQTEQETVTSVGEWFLTLLLMCIPCVGVILLFIWAFGNSTQKSKANWAKAQLIWAVIGIILTIIFYLVAGAALVSLLNSYGYNS